MPCFISSHNYSMTFTPMLKTFQWPFSLAFQFFKLALFSVITGSLNMMLPLPGMYFLFPPSSFHQVNDCSLSNPSWGITCSRTVQVLLLYVLKRSLLVFQVSFIYLYDYLMFNSPSRRLIPWEQVLTGSGLAQHCIFCI